MYFPNMWCKHVSASSFGLKSTSPGVAELFLSFITLIKEIMNIYQKCIYIW